MEERPKASTGLRSGFEMVTETCRAVSHDSGEYWKPRHYPDSGSSWTSGCMASHALWSSLLLFVNGWGAGPLKDGQCSSLTVGSGTEGREVELQKPK